MSDVTVSVGTKLIVWAAKGAPKMLKKVAAKYVPFQFENVAITIQPHPTINHNKAESICELRLSLSLRNATTYDLKLLTGQVELEISGYVFTSLSLPKIVILPVGKESTVYLTRPLTEFEYARAQKLFGSRDKQDCRCTLSLQCETAFGQQDYERRVSTSIDLLQS